MGFWADTSRIRGKLADDSGIALLTVVSVAVVVFLLLTTVLTLSVYHDSMSARYTARTRAMHMADAGVNAYLFELERWGKEKCLSDYPTLNSTMQDGSWNVDITQTNPFTIRSVGTITGPKPTQRTILATVRFPTFAEYMFLCDADISVGAGALIDGKVRANGTVVNSGHITGSTSAGGTISGSGQFDGAKYPNQPRVDFAAVTADMAAILSQAAASGTYFHNNSAVPAGYLPSTEGYLVTFNGTSVTIDAVTTINSSGVMTLGARETRAIPASGVFYFKPIGTKPVYVRGSYGAKVTLVCSNGIQIVDNLTPADPTANQMTAGLIAGTDIYVPTQYSSVPNVMVVQAAMLAQSGKIYGDTDSVLKSKITIRGAMAYRVQSGFVRSDGSRGWAAREYVFDPRLNNDPPPMYPQNRQGALRVSTWIEQ